VTPSSSATKQLRDWFDDFALATRLVLPGILFFALIITIATLGYMALSWSFVDALYMTVITVFGVGFGEVRPITSFVERAWTMTVIVGGWTGIVAALGRVLRAVTEGELRRATDSRRKLRAVEHLNDHVIICGYGRMGQALARELFAAKFPFVIIDRDEERCAQIATENFIHLHGDATDEATLQLAGIERARTLATVLPQDALNVFITLTARNLSASVHIVARGEQPSTRKKLFQAGASEVVLPATIAALRIAHSVAQPEIAALLERAQNDLDWRGLGLEVDELTLHPHAPLVGKSVAEVGKLGAGDVMILGVRRGGEVLRDHLPSIILREGDALVAISREKGLPSIIERDVDKTELL
jgi:voltage-gated potassium channel